MQSSQRFQFSFETKRSKRIVFVAVVYVENVDVVKVDLFVVISVAIRKYIKENRWVLLNLSIYKLVEQFQVVHFSARAAERECWRGAKYCLLSMLFFSLGPNLWSVLSALTSD